MGGGGNGSEPMIAEMPSPGGMSSPTGEYVDVFPDSDGQGGEFEEGGMGYVEIPKELDPTEAAAASTILGKLFEKLSLLSLLKVDASVQVRRRVDSVSAAAVSRTRATLETFSGSCSFSREEEIPNLGQT